MTHIMEALQEQEERDQFHHGKDSLVKESISTTATNPFFVHEHDATAVEDDLTTEDNNTVMDLLSDPSSTIVHNPRVPSSSDVAMTESDILKSLLQPDVASLQQQSVDDDVSTHEIDHAHNDSSNSNNRRVDGQFNFSDFLRWHQQSEAADQSASNESSTFLAQFARAQDIDSIPTLEGAPHSLDKEEQQDDVTGSAEVVVMTEQQQQQQPRIHYTRDQLLALKDHPLSNRKLEIKDIRTLPPPPPPPSSKSPQQRPVVDTDTQRKEKTRDRSGRALLPTPHTTPRGKRVPGSSPRKGTSRLSSGDRKTTKTSPETKSVARTSSWMTDEGGPDETKEELRKRKAFEEFRKKNRGNRSSSIPSVATLDEKSKADEKINAATVGSNSFFGFDTVGGMDPVVEPMAKKKSSESSEISFDDFSDLEHLIASAKLTTGDKMETGRFSKWFGSSADDDGTRTNKVDNFIAGLHGKQTTTEGRSKFMSLLGTSEEAHNSQEENKRANERYDVISQQLHHQQRQPSADNASKNKSSNVLEALFASAESHPSQHQHQERPSTFPTVQFTDAGSLEEQILQSYGGGGSGGGAASDSANKVQTQKSSPGFNVTAFFDKQFPQQQQQQQQWQHQQDMHMMTPHQQQQQHHFGTSHGFPQFIHPYQHQQHQNDRKEKLNGVSSVPSRSGSDNSSPSSANNVPTPRQQRSSKSGSGISLVPTQMLLREGKMLRKTSMSEKKDSPRVDKGTMNPNPNVPLAPYHPPLMMHPPLPNSIHYQPDPSQWTHKPMQSQQQQMMMAPMNPNQTMYMQQPYPHQQQQQQHQYPRHFHTQSSNK